MYSDLFTLADGRQVFMRPLTPADDSMVGQFFLGLSDNSRFQRFHSPRKYFSKEELTAIAGVDHHTNESLAAFSCPDAGLIGLAQFMRDDSDGTLAEVAIAVADRFQGMGIGTGLLKRLSGHARKEGITRFRARVLSSNRSMLRLARRIGSLCTMRYDSPGVIEADVCL